MPNPGQTSLPIPLLFATNQTLEYASAFAGVCIRCGRVANDVRWCVVCVCVWRAACAMLRVVSGVWRCRAGLVCGVRSKSKFSKGLPHPCE